jgi:pimeloyl-ACP methyl ester carboxylesterase
VADAADATDLLTPATDEGRLGVGGAEVAWERWARPGAPPVVLVHGTSAHRAWWHHAVSALTDRYDVVALDLSGHGDSGRRDRYSMAGWAEDVLGVVAAVCGGRAFVVGHSIGGLVAAGAAARAPEAVAGLVLADTIVVPPPRPAPAPLRPRPVRTFVSLAAAVERFRLEPPQPVGDRTVFDYVAARSLRTVPGGWAWKVDPAIWDVVSTLGRLLDDLPGVGCPAVVVRGELSSLVGPDAGAVLARLWGREVRQYTVPGAHHHLMIDARVSFGGCLRAALRDLSEAGTQPRRAAVGVQGHDAASLGTVH